MENTRGQMHMWPNNPSRQADILQHSRHVGTNTLPQQEGTAVSLAMKKWHKIPSTPIPTYALPKRLVYYTPKIRPFLQARLIFIKMQGIEGKFWITRGHKCNVGEMRRGLVKLTI